LKDEIPGSNLRERDNLIFNKQTFIPTY